VKTPALLSRGDEKVGAGASGLRLVHRWRLAGGTLARQRAHSVPNFGRLGDHFMCAHVVFRVVGRERRSRNSATRDCDKHDLAGRPQTLQSRDGPAELSFSILECCDEGRH